MPQIHIIAEMHLLPGCRESLMPAFNELVNGSRAEPGNISYELTEALDDPDHLFVLETWASEQAIEAHNASPHFRNFARVIAGKRKDDRVVKVKKLL